MNSVLSSKELTLSDKSPNLVGYMCQILNSKISKFMFRDVLLLSIPKRTSLYCQTWIQLDYRLAKYNLTGHQITVMLFVVDTLSS
jgi:hypothetical protein